MSLKKLLPFLVCAAMLFTSGCQSVSETSGTSGAVKTQSGETLIETATETTAEADASETTAAEASSDIGDALEMKHTLRFGEDGEFKVVMFSDIHNDSVKAPLAVEAIIENEKPDLILFGGDTTMGATEEAVREVLDPLCAPMESRGIPWAHVFGNHDAEFGITREKLQEIYTSYEWNVSKSIDGIYGVSNYVLPVLASDTDEIKFAVWGIDSNMYLKNFRAGLDDDVTLDNKLYTGYPYDYIHPDQIMWYYNTSKALENLNGQKVPSMMYFHIPFPQFNLIPMNPKATKMTDHSQESIWTSDIDSGMFAALVDRNDVLGVFCGHDHINDYVGEYCGIKLGYVSTVSMNTYNDPAMMGARVFVIKESEPDKLDTYMTYLTDEKYAGIYDRKDFTAPVTESIPDTLSEGVLFSFDGFEPKASSSLTVSGRITGNFYVSGFNAETISKNAAPVLSTEKAGYKNGDALGITKKTTKANSEISLYFEDTVTYNGEKYLRAYVDFTGVDFRKACFGLVAQDGTVYRTDELDNAGRYVDLYLLDDGATAWRVLEHGDDGCFGTAQTSPVKDFKGWVAVCVDDMPGWSGPSDKHSANSGKYLGAGDKLSGVYFYFDLSDEAMLGKTFIFDEIGLCGDYSVFK